MIRLLLVPILLAGGCAVPLPGFTTEGTNAAAAVGSAGSWTRPLKVGRATKADVLNRLGEPDRRAWHGDEWLYQWSTVQGFAVLFGPISDRRAILLRFDEAGVLVAFEREDGRVIGSGFGLASAFVPDGPGFPFRRTPLPGDPPRPRYDLDPRLKRPPASPR